MTKEMHWIVASILLSTSVTAFADEAYVVRFAALGKTSGCAQALWLGDAVFYNQNASSAEVRLLDISNGEVAPEVPKVMTLGPGESQAASQSRVAAGWVPRDANALNRFWVMHIDIPSGVVVDGRDEVAQVLSCIPDSPPGPFAKTPLPVFRSLAPAGSRQLKLGTDLGTTSARQNVAIYNAADQMATATIEVRRACDDQIVDSRTVTVPPRTIIQFGGFIAGSNQCQGTEVRANFYVRYTVITVDRPSLSLVSTITEDQTKSADNVIPLIEFSVK